MNIEDRLRAGLRQVPAAVAIVTAGRGEAALGVTATSVTAASLAPPTLLTCVRRALRLNAAIRAQGRFRISYLAREQEMIARVFSGGNGDSARFGFGEWDLGAPSGPALNGALLSIACRLNQAVECGTHSIFLGDVETVEAGAGAPLLYCDGLYRDLAETD